MDGRDEPERITVVCGVCGMDVTGLCSMVSFGAVGLRIDGREIEIDLGQAPVLPMACPTPGCGAARWRFLVNGRPAEEVQRPDEPAGKVLRPSPVQSAVILARR